MGYTICQSCCDHRWSESDMIRHLPSAGWAGKLFVFDLSGYPNYIHNYYCLTPNQKGYSINCYIASLWWTQHKYQHEIPIFAVIRLVIYVVGLCPTIESRWPVNLGVLEIGVASLYSTVSFTCACIDTLWVLVKAAVQMYDMLITDCPV